MVRSRSASRLVAVVALLAAVGGPLAAVSPASAQRTPTVPVDLAAITLTTADLEAEGFAGYGVANASPLDVDAAAAAVGNAVDQGVDEVAEALDAAGYAGGYSADHDLPAEGADPADPSAAPAGRFTTSAYLFGDEADAADAFETITGADADEQLVEGLGDASTVKLLGYETADPFGVPVGVVQIEVLSGRAVLEVGAIAFGDGAAEATDAEQEATAEAITPLADRLVDRAEDALSGDAPGLGALVVEVEAAREVDAPTFRAYDLLEGEGVRLIQETDDGFPDRVEGQLDRGTVSLIRSEQHLSVGSDDRSALRLYDTILRFEDEDAAVAYLDGLVDRLDHNGVNVSADALDVGRGIGDESLGVALVRDDAEDGRPYDLNELFVRVGDTVGIVYVDEDDPVLDPPEVAVEALVPLGEAQAACFEEGACDGPLDVPDDLAEILAGR